MTTPARSFPYLQSALRALAWSFALLLCLTLAGGSWLLASESGLHALLGAASQLSAGALQVEGVAGHAAGDLRIARLSWQSAGSKVVLEGVHLAWQPQALLHGRIEIGRLEAASLRYESLAAGAPSAPLSLPQDIGPPWPLQVEQLQLGRLEIAGVAQRLNDIQARFVAGPQAYRIEALSLRSEQLLLQGVASLGAQQPFALHADLSLAHSGEKPFSLAVQAQGELADMAITLAAQGSVQGKALLQLQPFAANPLQSAHVDLQGVDPATWLAGAPHARLNLAGELRAKDGAHKGQLLLSNELAGGLEQARIPLRSLRLTLAGTPDDLALQSWQAELLGAARITGKGRWHAGVLSLQGEARALDAARIHASALPTRLSGPLELKLGAQEQFIKLDLTDPRVRIQARASRAAGRILVERVRLDEGRAHADLRGEYQEAQRSFKLEGELVQLDLSHFAKLPASSLNAHIAAQGQARTPLQLDLDFVMPRSQLAGYVLEGAGDVGMRGDQVRVRRLYVAAGENRLEASGEFGLPGDALQLKLHAPKLEQIGLRGALDMQASLRGSVQAPAVQASAHAAQLGWPGRGELSGLDARLDFGAGADDPLQADIRVASVQLAQQPAVQDLSLKLDGRWSQHRLRLHAQREALLLDAQLAGHADLPAQQWQGQLETLSLAGGLLPLSLQAPAGLQVSARAAKLESLVLKFTEGSLNIDSALWQPGHWATRGSLQTLPAARLLGVEGDLLLDGQWDLSWPAQQKGRLTLKRHSGDLALGDAQGLGLEKLVAQLGLEAGRLNLDLQAQGARLGRLQAQAAAQLPQDPTAWQNAPLSGKLEVDMPDLRWLGGQLSKGVRTRGALKSALSLSGSLGAPRWQGSISGEKLGVHLLDNGLWLENGRLDAHLDGFKLELASLGFDSRYGGFPLENRLQIDALTARPGRVETAGTLDLADSAGSLNVRFERFGALQKPKAWLLLSGTAKLGLAQRRLQLGGELAADAAWFEMPAAGRPKLSDDVVVLGREDRAAQAYGMVLDLAADLGPAFHFKGAGLNTRLAGQLRLRSNEAGLPRLSGSVKTADGVFEAYGARLLIERGILNFQGQPDNPGLNVLAMRRGKEVEAGVEVSGTLKSPRIHLVSEPDVPDQEKLSWMVLGHGPDQQTNTNESALMVSAAVGLLGENSMVRSLRRNLGVDQLEVRSGSLDGSERGRSSRVASTQGFGSGAGEQADQIFSVGKELADGLSIAYEESLLTAGSVVKLTYRLTHAISLIGRAGTENSVDLRYSLRFGK